MSITRRQFVQTSAAIAAFSSPAVRAFAQDAKIVKLGGSAPFSGNFATLGLDIYEGYKIAVKYINEVLGGFDVAGEKYKLELNIIDDASDPQRAVTLLQRQLDEGVDLFLGSYSSTIVLPQVAITERARKPLVQAGGGSDQLFTHGYKYSFGIYPRSTRQCWSVAELLVSLGIKQISTVSTNDPTGTALIAGFKEKLATTDIQVLEDFKLPANVNEVSGIVNSVRANPPEALMCFTAGEQPARLIVQQMVSTNTTVKLLFISVGPETEAFRTALGKYSNEILYNSGWDPRSTFKDPIFGNTQNYFEYFEANAQRDWSTQTAAASACIVTYVEAMKKAGTVEPQAVRDALAASDFSSMYGPVKFTPDGDGDAIAMAIRTAQIQDGKSEIVFPEAAATAKVRYPIKPWSERS